jgi:hypothetical protein
MERPQERPQTRRQKDKHMAGKFQVETVMTLGKATEPEALDLIKVIQDEALLTHGWLNSDNRDFREAIKFARMFIANNRSWE